MIMFCHSVFGFADASRWLCFVELCDWCEFPHLGVCFRTEMFFGRYAWQSWVDISSFLYPMPDIISILIRYVRENNRVLFQYLGQILVLLPHCSRWMKRSAVLLVGEMPVMKHLLKPK